MTKRNLYKININIFAFCQNKIKTTGKGPVTKQAATVTGTRTMITSLIYGQLDL